MSRVSWNYFFFLSLSLFSLWLFDLHVCRCHEEFSMRLCSRVLQKMQQHNYWTRHVFSYIYKSYWQWQRIPTHYKHRKISYHISFFLKSEIVVISYRLIYIAYSQTSAGYPWRSQLQGASRRVAPWHQVPWAPWVSSPWYSHGLRDR